MTRNTRRKNCKFRKAKGQLRELIFDHEDAIKSVLSVVFIIWMAITLLMWGFTQKTVTETVCGNVTDEQRPSVFGGDYCKPLDTWGIYDPPCRTYERCDQISHEEYYTLPEIFGQQADFICNTISGTATWITSHPVV